MGSRVREVGQEAVDSATQERGPPMGAETAGAAGLHEAVLVVVRRSGGSSARAAGV